MKFLDKDAMIQQVENFQRLGVAFEVKVSNDRMYITGDMGEYMIVGNKIPVKELVYIGMVRRYILDNNLQNSVPVIRAKIDYYKHSKKLGGYGELKDCYEIDLKSAYWEMANKLGLISPGLYKKAVEVNPNTGEPYMSKITRLAAIGSLARKYRVYSYDEDGEVTKRRWRSRKTEHIWDYICYKVGKIMNEGVNAVGDGFLFFWVDALFVKTKEDKDKVVQVFKKAGYESTVKKCEKIVFAEKIEVYCKMHKKKKRKFPYEAAKVV